MKKKEYNRLIFEQQTPYLQWLKEKKQLEEALSYTGELFDTLPFSSCEDKLETCLAELDWNAVDDSKWLIFSRKIGMLDHAAYGKLERFIQENPKVRFIYPDEDYLGTLDELYGLPKNTEEVVLRRGKPWFKPDFSPDTLESFFYFGNCFAVEVGTWKRWIKGMNMETASIYDAVWHGVELERTSWEECFRHIPEMLYTNGYFKDEQELPGMREGKAVLEKTPLVSVIIPTRDHIEVLDRCLITMLEKTVYQHYEIILVDNGSTEENVLWINNRISELIKSYGIQIRYIYDKKEFNFSFMCNLGAKNAGGEVYVFLNNDMEILEGTWMEMLLSKVLQSHVGAVGAKLLFPKKEGESNYRIQHAGVANMLVGPMHKLCGMEDRGNLYHGHNRLVYNSLIVTGACLMIRKEVFWAAGGFDERFPVAYNDVELCIRLHEAGYYNVQRNDCVLIHHESLSRGRDTTSKQQKRLFQEMDLLYTLHPAYRGKDPYYHQDLVQSRRDVDYVCEYQYPYEKVQSIFQLTSKQLHRLPKTHNSRVLGKLLGEHDIQLQIEGLQQENREVLRLDGWSIWQKKDNSNLNKWILLKNLENTQSCYQIACEPKLREDVAQVFSDTTMRLSGFQVMFAKKDIPSGSYQVGMLMQSNKRVCKCAKVCWSEVIIKINDENDAMYRC